MIVTQGFCQTFAHQRIFELLNSNNAALFKACHNQIGKTNSQKAITIGPLYAYVTPNTIKLPAYANTNIWSFLRNFSTSRVIKNTDGQPNTKITPITFYYDTLSPYSWLAFEMLQRYRPIWNLEVDFKPVYMGGITKENDNKFLESLTRTPNRAAYIFQDVVRTAEFYQVPLRVPESPLYLLAVAGSLKQQRFLTAVKKLYPEYLESCSREFWYRCWSEDLDATKDASIFMVAMRAGLKEDEILNCLEDIQTDDLKYVLKETTSEAVKAGAFGLPFMTIERDNTVDRFWGSDRFEIMANSLGVEWHGPVPDNVCYVPISMPPPNPQEEMLKTLEDIGAIKTDFNLENELPEPRKR